MQYLYKLITPQKYIEITMLSHSSIFINYGTEIACLKINIKS